MHMQEDEHIEAWELEWQDYASDPDTLDREKPGGLALLLLWATCIIVCLAVWAGVIWVALSVVHWIQRLL